MLSSVKTTQHYILLFVHTLGQVLNSWNSRMWWGQTSRYIFRYLQWVKYLVTKATFSRPRIERIICSVFFLAHCSFPLSFLPFYVFVWAGDDGVAWSYNPGPQGDHGGGRNLLPGSCHGDPHSHHPAPQDCDVSLYWMAISNTLNTRIHIHKSVWNKPI